MTGLILNADVIDPKADKIAAPELAVDGEVEQREIACAVLDLKSTASEDSSRRAVIPGWRGTFLSRSGAEGDRRPRF
jgi:hypothetical protein